MSKVCQELSGVGPCREVFTLGKWNSIFPDLYYRVVGVIMLDHGCYHVPFVCMCEIAYNETHLLGKVQCDFVYLNVL